LKNDSPFVSSVVITASDTECTIVSNSVPNHDFNDQSAAFAGGTEGATITAIEATSTITRAPAFASEPTYISQEVKNAIFLNGVRLDIFSAGCYRPTDEKAGEDGNIGIGCESDAA